MNLAKKVSQVFKIFEPILQDFKNLKKFQNKQN